MAYNCIFIYLFIYFSIYVVGRSHLFCDLSFFVGLVNIWYITRVQDHVDILEECFILFSTKKKNSVKSAVSLH